MRQSRISTPLTHMCRAATRASSVVDDGEFLSSLAEANSHMQAAQTLINTMLTADV
jgi:hypothetical protein